ncbi:hypothetical protein FPV67DRAFT_116324 [Lyophyllum atratum]|nr:hypothetical protein FPV67DRAFT_116324 [Lyophyllum atratum]
MLRTCSGSSTYKGGTRDALNLTLIFWTTRKGSPSPHNLRVTPEVSDRRASNDPAAMTSMPDVQDAARIAQRIEQLSQNVKFNKKASRRLATDARSVVDICILLSESGEFNSADHLVNVENVARTLQEICDYTEQQVLRNVCVLRFRRETDARLIQEYRHRLQRFMSHLSHTLSLLNEALSVSLLNHLEPQDRDAHNAQAPTQPSNVDEVTIDEEVTQRERRQTREISTTVQIQQDDLPARWAVHDPRGLPLSTSNPFRPSGSQFGPHVYFTPPSAYSTPPGLFLHQSFTSVAGSQNTYSRSVVNTNSGNTTTRVITNSGNNTSMVAQHGRGR